MKISDFGKSTLGKGASWCPKTLNDLLELPCIVIFYGDVNGFSQLRVFEGFCVPFLKKKSEKSSANRKAPNQNFEFPTKLKHFSNLFQNMLQIEKRGGGGPILDHFRFLAFRS